MRRMTAVKITTEMSLNIAALHAITCICVNTTTARTLSNLLVHCCIISNSLFNPLPLQWRHNGRDGVSNHQPHDCFLNHLFRRRSKKISKLRVTGELPANKASNAENVSMWWRHHDLTQITICEYTVLVKMVVTFRHFLLVRVKMMIYFSVM